MTKIKKIGAALLPFSAYLVPNAALAQANKTCDELKKYFENAGGANVIANVPQYCSYESLYEKFINTALFAVGIVAVIAIIYGGYLYMTAQGNEAQTKKGRDVLTWAIIGLIVVVAAAVIVNVVVSGLVENRFV